MSAGARDAVDMDLYSRQIGTYGLDTMSRLTNLRVLVSGLQGPGVETAKNLVLAGPKQVLLHDTTVVEAADLGSNFYLSEADVGKRTRAEACVEKLSSLNTYVAIEVLRGTLTRDVLKNVDVLVVFNYDKNWISELDGYCRLEGVKMIAANCFGLAFSVFVDFGDQFLVKDTNGEEPKSLVIQGVDADRDANGALLLDIHCTDDKRVPFSVGDTVKLENLDFVSCRELQARCAELLCATEAEILKLSSKYDFRVRLNSEPLAEALAGHSTLQVSGHVRQVKQAATIQFLPYDQSCDRPVCREQGCLTTIDLAKFGRPEQLHLATQALLESANRRDGKLPESSAEVLALAQQLKTRYAGLSEDVDSPFVPVQINDVDETVVAHVVKFASCSLSPISVIVGGIVAQEIVKTTGKFTPIHQWLYFDAFELVANIDHATNPASFQRSGSRYDDYYQVWGREIQQILAQTNLFLVGTGALGCEYLKNFAMLGIATAPGKAVTLTDMDRIEVSNLNRQFLFRKEHVGQSKSQTAGAVINTMNPDIHVRALEARVGVDTENTVFNEEFWNAQDVIVNALDNVASRLYVDSKCVWHLKPLLESGTLGTKGNVQVILPRLTESYGDSRDPPDENIPLCTLRHFPNQIEHTMEWARDLFQGRLADCIQETNNVLKFGAKSLDLLRSQTSEQELINAYKRIRAALTVLSASNKVDKAIELGVLTFHELFHDAIAELLFNFPVDHVNDDGTPFWCGPKRAPQVLDLDLQDTTQVAFVSSMAVLFADALKVSPLSELLQTVTGERVRAVASQMIMPKFEPKKVVIPTNDEEAAAQASSAQEATVGTADKLRAEILEMVGARMTDAGELTPPEFEKDDDLHIAFVAAAGNLRARNYRIPEVEVWRAKMIAGKIIPAIATTTAMITGFATLELIKVLTREKLGRQLDHFKNTFANLSLPLWLLSEPGECKQFKSVDYDPIVGGPVRCKPAVFTSWDRTDVNLPRSAPLKELIQTLEGKFDTSVSVLSAGNVCLYMSYGKQTKLERPLHELLKEAAAGPKSDINPDLPYCILHACCTDEDGVDVNIPVVKCQFVD